MIDQWYDSNSTNDEITNMKYIHILCIHLIIIPLGGCTEREKEDARALEKVVRCSAYKTVRFSCASAGNIDACMNLRFGADYMSYEYDCQ